MAFTNFNGFKSKFVYYEDLQRTYPHIYNELKNSVNLSVVKHDSEMLRIASTMRGWAATEGAKEIQLLSQYFGVSNLSLGADNLYTKEAGKQIVNAINISLQFKDVYQRHITRILGIKDGEGGGQGKITGAQFFSQYFSSTLLDIIKEEYDNIANLDNYTVKQLEQQLFSQQNIQRALSDTLFKKMAESGDWKKGDEHKGYKEFFAAVNKFKQSAEFMDQVAEAYGLDEILQNIQNTIISKDQLEKLVNGKNGATTLRTVIKDTNLAKGTFAEIFGQQGLQLAINAISEKIPGAQKTSVAKVVGGSLGKADIVATFELDYSEIADVVEKYYSNRTERVVAYNKLNSKLENMKKGFIVYTNVKDYTLVKNIDNKGLFKGFSSGSDISLASLEGVLSAAPGQSQELIGLIMSSMKGAVANELLPQLEELLVEKMAYFLFDDVLTIGRDTKAGARAIHMMLLDGVYIPLSYLFLLMAEAIEEVDRETNEIFDVSIKPGNIKYPNPPWKPGMWTSQKSIGYEQIKIGAKFLKKFVDVVREFA